MDLTEAPHFVATRLAALSHAAASAVLRDDELNAQIADLRDRCNGRIVRAGDHPEKLRAALEARLEEQRALQRQRPIDMGTLESCKVWLAALPSGTLLDEQVNPDVNGLSLPDVRERIKNMQDVVTALKHVPIPTDVREKVGSYVEGLTRPIVGGIGADQALTVRWPTELQALIAFLQPDMLADRLMAEIDRIANTPYPLPQREQRIAELEREIDRLQRIEESLVVATGAPRERGCLP